MECFVCGSNEEVVDGYCLDRPDQCFDDIPLCFSCVDEEELTPKGEHKE